MSGKRIKRNGKTVGHYLRVYFLSLFVSVGIFAVGYFFRPQFICANSATCKSDLSLNVDNNAIGFFQGQKVTPPKIDLLAIIDNSKSSILGVHVSNSSKHIYVDLSSQTLYAYEGSALFMSTFIASGRWGKTPVGNFNVWEKLPATRMAGGEGAAAYDLPNVPWVMYFFHDFGLHGAYWHNNFGHTMSHGCVNMRIVDAHTLYDWADGPKSDQLGTPVSVCNQFTGPGTCIQDNPIN